MNTAKLQPLSYTKDGNGPNVVLLHGFCEAKEYWDEAMETLAKSFTVISIDLPGFGSSPELKQNTTMETLAEAVHNQLVAMEIDEFVLVGHSLGGYVSLAFIEKYAQMIKGLVMCNSTAFADSDEKKLQRNKSIVFLNENGLEAFIRPFVPPMFYPKNKKKCEAAIQNIVKMGLKASETGVKNAVVAMRDRPDRSSLIAKAIFPVLYIIGKNDEAVKFADSLAQCHLAPFSYALFMDECEHQAIHEKPQETIGAIRSFTNKCLNV